MLASETVINGYWYMVIREREREKGALRPINANHGNQGSGVHTNKSGKSFFLLISFKDVNNFTFTLT